MKRYITTIVLTMFLAVIAFGYVSTPVQTFSPHDPTAPSVIGSKTIYINNDVTFSIDVEDSNDDTLVITTQDGIVTKKSSVYKGDTTITDANGTFVFHIYSTTYDIKYHPIVEGYQYKQVKVIDSQGAEDIKYVELDVRKKNITPVITGCR